LALPDDHRRHPLGLLMMIGAPRPIIADLPQLN